VIRVALLQHFQCCLQPCIIIFLFAEFFTERCYFTGGHAILSRIAEGPVIAGTLFIVGGVVAGALFIVGRVVAGALFFVGGVVKSSV
jgi:hypothetical protein